MKYMSFQAKVNCGLSGEQIVKARGETESRVNDNRPVFFLKQSSNEWINMTVIVTNPYMESFDEIGEAISFLDSIGVKDIDEDEIYWYEIGRDLMVHELREASNSFYVHDVNDILWDVGIRYEYNDRRWSEKMIEGSSPIDFENPSDSIEKAVGHILGSKPLREELERIIESSKNLKVSNIPVHYVIESDSSSDRSAVLDMLFKTLFEAERINTSRCMTYRLKPFGFNGGEWESDIAELYDEYSGGLVALDGTDEETLGYLLENGTDLCRTITSHRDDTVTVILLPAENEAIKEVLVSELEECRFISLLQTELNGEDSVKFISAICEKQRLEMTEDMRGKFNDKTLYPVSYIEEVLKSLSKAGDDEMSNIYAGVKEDAFMKQKEAAVEDGSADSELYDLIGLESVLEETKGIISRIKTENYLKRRGLNIKTGPMNFVFTGSPGVAKTTVARLLAKQMHKEGIVSTDQVIEAGRKNLIGRYEGETSSNVRNAFRKAHGKVLFIDEAYSLMEHWGGKTSGYGKEAIDVIVEELGTPKSDMVVIMAGYPDEMEELLDSNPGLKSRMNYYVEFPDYSTDELLDILEYHTKQRGMGLEPEVKKTLKPYIESARMVKNFGNGRFVVNVLDKAVNRQRLRISKNGFEEMDKLSDEEIMTLKSEDFKDVEDMVCSLKSKKDENGRIGFTS